MKPAKDILPQVELELTSRQLDAIRTRAATLRCTEEEYVRRLVGAAMLQNVLLANFEVPETD